MEQLEQKQEQKPVVAGSSSSRTPRDNSSLVGLSVAMIVFLAVPYELYVFGFPLITDFAITIFLAGLLTDIFTTKIGFNRGYDDYNVFYSLAKKKKVKNNSFLVGIFVFGVIRAALIVYFWDNVFILLLVATMSLIGPLWNSILLSSPDKKAGATPYNEQLEVTPEVEAHSSDQGTGKRLSSAN